jgi:hydantoinase/carbamoylase family amidase
MLMTARWMEDAGLSPRLDRFGNLWGLPYTDGRFVTSGSHVDTVPNGGCLDGALGTVLAIEAARDLGGPFGVLVCAGEEALRFGAGSLGSRQLVGELGDADLEHMWDANGTSALEAREEFLRLLFDVPRIEEADPLSRVTAQLEVHIEQRRGIKEEDASVGIATAVAGSARHRLCFSGETGHSGEARMHERRDALCAAAEVILLIEGLARKVASTVATVRTVAVEPNSLTAIPGSVELGLDVRSNDPEEAEELVSKIIERGREISSGRGVYLSVRRLSASAAFRRLVQRCEPRARRGHRTRGPKECLRDGNGALA